MKRNYYILLSLTILFLITLNYDNLINFFTLKEGLTKEEKNERDAKLDKLDSEMKKIKDSLYNSKEENNSNEKISYINYLNSKDRKKKIKKFTELYIEWIKTLWGPFLDAAKEEMNKKNRTSKEHEKDFKRGLSNLYAYFMNLYTLNVAYDMDLISIILNNINDSMNSSGGGDDDDYDNMLGGVTDSFGL